MQEELLLLFLFLALALGWVAGNLTRAKSVKPSPAPASGGKHRLQLLFDSYNDDTLDNFIHSLDVTAETFGLHLSIGKHFRTEGEVEKAIFIHQNLMSHPELSKQQTEPVVYELAKDYKAAGLFDRAESLLEQLMNSKEFAFRSRKLLLSIYEQQRDWLKAANLAEDLDTKKRPELSVNIAQYYCELAEEAQAFNQAAQSRKYFKQALKADKACVRAHLAFAQSALDEDDIRSALTRLRALVDQAPDFVELALPLMLECTRRSETFSQYCGFLKELYQRTGNVNVLLSIFELYKEVGEPEEGLAYLERETQAQPSLAAAQALLHASVTKTQHQAHECEHLWQVMSEVIEKISAAMPAFRCENCGYSSNHLHWLCPSCKSWQSIKPNSGAKPSLERLP